MRLYDYAGVVVQSCLLLQGLPFQLVYSNIQGDGELDLQSQTMY